MPANALVRARIDEKLKNEAAAVLAEMGLTVSDLVRMTLTRVARDKAVPFDLKVPNAETEAAMEQARLLAKSDVTRYKTLEAAFDSLEQSSQDDQLENGSNERAEENQPT